MPTPGERKALLFLGVVVALGAGARGVAVLHSQAPIDVAARRALDGQISALDSLRQGGKKNGRAKRSKRSKGGAIHIATPGAELDPPADAFRSESPPIPAIIDLDIATPAEIETLRGIGPALARRIVADRDSLGPFGSLDELERVRGIGHRLAQKIAPQVTFSLLPRHSGTASDGTSAPPRGRRKSGRGESHN
jgi:DNA uptake protein ComE-like DNA-binding protein